MTPHRCIDACNLRVRAKNLPRRDLFVSFCAGNKIFRKGTRWRSRDPANGWTVPKKPASLTRHRVRSARAIDASLTARRINRANERRVDRILDRFDLRAEIKQTPHDSTRERATTSLKKHALLHSR